MFPKIALTAPSTDGLLGCSFRRLTARTEINFDQGPSGAPSLSASHACMKFEFGPSESLALQTYTTDCQQLQFTLTLHHHQLGCVHLRGASLRCARTPHIFRLLCGVLRCASRIILQATRLPAFAFNRLRGDPALRLTGCAATQHCG